MHNKALFEQRIGEIIAHNSNPANSWKKGVNKFTDRTDVERSGFFGYDSSMSATMPQSTLQAQPLKDLPAAVDWRKKGVVTPVKNQGSCGSCWAFAAVETLESFLILAVNATRLLSPQNMLACTPNPQHCGGTGGCSGATSELGYQYVADKGIASEADYPYRARDTPCDETKPKTVKSTGFVKLPENDYAALATAVATLGPMAVSVDASEWFAYSSGVFTGCPTSRIDINHAVQAVGYGTDGGRDYWTVRNSWGGTWGEQGYIRIFKFSDGAKSHCGIDPSPQDGTGCDGGPSQVTVCGSCGIWYDSSYPTGVTLVK